MSEESQPVITLKNLSFRYQQNWLFENLNLNVEARDFLAMLGPNGAGKTTLIKIILGLLKPEQGEVRILGAEPEASRSKIGYLPQGNFFDRDFPLVAREVIAYGLIQRRTFLPFFSPAELAKVEQIMRELNLLACQNTPIGELSGGQRQRVLIARALVAEPQVLILDEPSTHIDSMAEKELYALLQRLNQKITIIIVSHDISAVSKFVNKVACVNKNLVVNEIATLLEAQKIKPCFSSDCLPLKHSCSL